MTGLPTITASKISARSMPASAAAWPARSLRAARTAAVISAAPPGFIIA